MDEYDNQMGNSILTNKILVLVYNLAVNTVLLKSPNYRSAVSEGGKKYYRRGICNRTSEHNSGAHDRQKS